MASQALAHFSLAKLAKAETHGGDTERTQKPNRHFQFRFHFHFILRQGLFTGPWLSRNYTHQASLELRDVYTFAS